MTRLAPFLSFKRQTRPNIWVWSFTSTQSFVYVAIYFLPHRIALLSHTSVSHLLLCNHNLRPQPGIPFVLVVEQALRLLETRDRQLTWLRAQMADSLEQVQRGEVYEDNDEFWADLDREVDERLSRGEVANPDVCP